MPESKIDPYHCGTVAPIWMRGQHPSVADGIVNRDACVNFKGKRNGCYVVIQIRVKNCNGFFVYYLKPAHGCHMAYCAGMLLNCFVLMRVLGCPAAEIKYSYAHPNPSFNDPVFNS